VIPFTRKDNLMLKQIVAALSLALLSATANAQCNHTQSIEEQTDDAATQTTQAPNVGYYVWNESLQQYDLVYSEYDPNASSYVPSPDDVEVVVQGGTVTTPAPGSYGPSPTEPGPGGGNHLEDTGEEGPGENSTECAPEPPPPVELPPVKVTGATIRRTPIGAGIGLRIIVVGYGGGGGSRGFASAGGKKVKSAHPGYNCGTEHAAKIANARQSIAQRTPYPPRFSIWTVEYDNGQKEDFMVTTLVTVGGVELVSGCR
jgi:hypothetical protein